MSRLPILALTALLGLPLAQPAAAQAARGGGIPGDLTPGAAVALDCVPGNITCLATVDATCRAAGGLVHLSMTMASAVTLRCEADRHDLDEVFDEAAAQTETCTAGHLCLQRGSRAGDDADNVYRRLVGMMNACLRSHGRLEVHAIMPDGPNRSTVYAGCLPRA